MHQVGHELELRRDARSTKRKRIKWGFSIENFQEQQSVTYQKTLLCGVVFTAAEQLAVSFITLLPRLILLALPRRQVLQSACVVFIVACVY